MSGVVLFFGYVCLSFLLGLVVWLFWFFSIRRFFVGRRKRQLINQAKIVIAFCKGDVDLMVRYFVKYKIIDALVVRLADEEVRRVHDKLKSVKIVKEVENGSGDKEFGRESGKCRVEGDSRGNDVVAE